MEIKQELKEAILKKFENDVDGVISKYKALKAPVVVFLMRFRGDVTSFKLYIGARVVHMSWDNKPYRIEL
jgi:hypothetical protein